MHQLKVLSYRFQNWLYQPYKVFIVCLGIMMASLMINGTLWKVWGLYRDEVRFKQEIVQVKDDTRAVEAQMTLVKDPRYIERLAKDKMDLVSENDLVFVFPN